MLVPRPIALAILSLLFATSLRAAPIEADPHELYDEARIHLRNGELGSADASLRRLRSILSQGSQWDPDGVFANELLPPLLKKLRRMQVVTGQLDAFSERALKDLTPPEISSEASTLRPYTEWATSTIQRLRSERDQIIASRLADPEEQAAVTRTASYARTERILETDVMRSLADSSANAAPVRATEDPGIDPVSVRFRQLKRDLMGLMMERDRLEQEAKQTNAGEKAYLQALAVLVTEGSLDEVQSGSLQPTAISKVFGEFLDQELEAARSLTSQSSQEREARQEALDRYRRYNAVLTRAKLGTDQSRRIQALSRAVEDCPVKDGLLVTSRAARWLYGLLTSVLALVAGISSWMAIARGRKLSPARRSDEPEEPVIEAVFPRRKVGGNAA